MYLILNKENDYKTSRSKIQALELSYKGIVKLVSNQEGNLTENMLLNIKNAQDTTYSSVNTTRNQLKPVLNNLSIPLDLPELEYSTLDSNKFRPHELGYENFVDNTLLTNIMSNEYSLSEMVKKFYNRITIAESNFYNSNQIVRNKAIQKGVYTPPIYSRVDPKTINKTILQNMNSLEQLEFEKTFFQLKLKLPMTDYVYYNYLLFPNFYSFNYDITSGISFSDSRISFRTVVQDVNAYNEYHTVYCKVLSSNTEFLIARFPVSKLVGSGDKQGYKISNNSITIFMKKSSGDVWEYKLTTILPPAKITANIINDNF